MTDPTPPTPLEDAPGPEVGGQPNYIARSALGVMRRTERALSPWSRRLLQAGSTPLGRLQRSPAEAASAASIAPAPRSPFASLKSPAVTSRAALTLARRAQSAETPTVIQRSPEPRTALSLDRFASNVARRFPEMAAKYEPKVAEAPEVVQRAALPFVGSESAAPESSLSAMPMTAPEMPSDEGDSPFFPTISSEESVASQLAERLQTFRDQSSGGSQSPSPREISRLTAERAASRARAASPNQPVIRRSRIEEIGQKPGSLPMPTPDEMPPASKPAAPGETVQRKPAEPDAPRPPVEQGPKPKPVTPPPAKPVQADTPKPTIQRKPAASAFEGDESNAAPALEPRPGLPSLSQQLLQRYEAGRDEWNAESAASDNEPPAFLKSADQTEPPTVQRKPDSEGAKPPAPEKPVIEHRESRPARRVAPPKSAPVVQRKPQTVQSEDLPLQAKPPAEPPAQNVPTPTVQRSIDEPENIVEAEQSAPAVDEAPVPPPAKTAAADLPLAQPPATVQRKPDQGSAPDTPSDAPSVPRVTTTVPTIQRMSEAEPTPSESRVPPPADKPDLTPPQLSASQVSQPITQPSVEPPSIQRAVEALPLREPPPPPSSLQPVSEPTEIIETPTDTIITPPPVSQNLPLSAPPAVQRKPEAPRATISQAETPVEMPESVPSVEKPAPVQRAPSTEPRLSSLPLATPRTVIQPPTAAPSIQRTPAEDEPMPEAMPLVAVREAAPRPAPKPMAIVQRKPVDTGITTLDVPRPTLPLARTAPSVSNRVQREETTTESPSTDTSRGSSSDESKGEAKKSMVDLNDLARRIYPILKRMLAVERERR